MDQVQPESPGNTSATVAGCIGIALGMLDTLIARQGGNHVRYGSTLTLAAAAQSWAAETDTPIRELVQAAVH